MLGENTDKAGEAYWTSFWENNELPAPIRLEEKTISNYAFRKLHDFYKKAFDNYPTKGKSLIEIGCGNSVYLSYFNKYFGFEVNGLDYSELGCRQTRKILERDKINGNIYKGDLFHPDENLLNRFDAVCSFGVVEHFDDTAGVINRISRFAKPGGYIITSIPNLTGLTGFLQKIMNRPVYDIHKVMTLDFFKDEVNKAGLEVVQYTHIIPVSLGVTLDSHDGKQPGNIRIKKIILKSFQSLAKAFQIIDDKIVRLPSLPQFCAGMIVIARKPG